MIRIIAILLLVAAPVFAQNDQRALDRDTFASPVPPPPLQVYITENGQQIGPLDAAGFQGHLGTPEAAASTLVWMPGMAGWELASTVPQLQGIIAAIGQSQSNDGAFRVADIQSYMLGVWISEEFKWTQNDIPYDAIIQMKLLPNGQFEGATLFWDKEDAERTMRVDHEKGTWTITQGADGTYALDRNITYSSVIGTEITEHGQVEDNLTITPQGPNTVATAENIEIIRIPEAN